MIVKLLAVGPVSEKTGQREVFFEMNGEVRSIPVDDKHAGIVLYNKVLIPSDRGHLEAKSQSLGSRTSWCPDERRRC